MKKAFYDEVSSKAKEPPEGSSLQNVVTSVSKPPKKKINFGMNTWNSQPRYADNIREKFNLE